MTFIEIVLIAASAVATLLFAAHWLRDETRPSGMVPPGDDIALLFNGTALHHISDLAAQWFPVQPGQHDWADLRDLARDQFANFPDAPGDSDTVLTAPGAQELRSVCITRDGPQTRVTFVADLADKGPVTNNVAANHSERAAQTAPHPMWQTNDSGALIWSNPAFDKLAPHDNHPLLQIDTEGWTTAKPLRISVRGSDNSPDYWFDVTRNELDGIQTFHTQNASALVTAEEAQRNFVQTLAKTFAHLSIGLAIFDRNQQLALFNPALVDLSGLDAQFLSARPTMLSFFDRLREARRMPEPKNYRSWRQEIADVIVAANDGRYQESWTLESGQTFLVTGRPHPDGATAFLVEDISAEVSLTRNFRAELEMGQVMLDTVDDALVVFSRSGILTFCNAAYRELWALDPDNSFADVTLRDSIAAWRNTAQDGPIWQQIEDFAFRSGGREIMAFDLPLKNGIALVGETRPMPAGETLIRFMHQSPVPAKIPQPDRT